MPRPLLATAVVATACALPAVALAADWGWYLDGFLLVLGAAVAGYAAGAGLSTAFAVGSVGITVAVMVTVNQLQRAPYHWLDDLVFFAVVVGGPAAAGRVVSLRSERVARLHALADELHEQQRLAVAAARLDEQTRVQQQVHVALAERVAAIAVRAEGARRVGDPDSLAVIEDEARAVLDQVREVLGSLADTGSDSYDAQPEQARTYEPAPETSPSVWDVALTAVVAVAMVVEVVVHPLARGPVWADVAAGVLVVAPLVVRRSHPGLAVGLCLLVALPMTWWLTPLPVTVTGVALLSVLFYSIGAWSRPRWWMVLWAAAVAGALLLEQVSSMVDESSGGDGDAEWIVLVWLVAAVLLGRVTAGWQDRARRTADVVAALERGRDAATRLAVARERQALASELHDTVAHSMTVVCLQSAAARRGGAEPDEALRTIAATAASSVVELREGLDAIDAGHDPLDPSRLVAVGRRVGVEVVVDGPAVEPRPTGPAAALAFRVVREAIVNVARHAPGAVARVRVERDERTLRVEVVDGGGEAPSGLGAGTGLAGLARAVEEVGGELGCGPRRSSGFRVTARIPEGVA